MVRLDDMRIFAVLSGAESLSAAAQRLGMPKQTVSRRLAELELDLGVELARRTTRTLVLTDVGRAYAERCAEVVRLADEANRAAGSGLDDVSGILRATADNSFGETFLPRVVAEFVQRFPDAEVEVELTSRKVDILHEGFDVAFRVGPLPDVSYLAATYLAPARLWTVASPEYLARKGTPKSVAELADHDLLAAVPSIDRSEWPLLIRGELRLVRVSPRVRVNGLAMVRHAALEGVGIAHLPEFSVADDVDQRRLIRLLQPLSPDVGGIHVVYPHSRLLAPRVTEFVSLARERFGGGPGKASSGSGA